MRLRISEEGIEITHRFFLAIDALRERKIIRGLKTFTDKYDINYWNMTTLKNEPTKRILKVEWLAHLVRDYGLSPSWLLTGSGKMFEEDNTSNNS